MRMTRLASSSEPQRLRQDLLLAQIEVGYAKALKSSLESPPLSAFHYSQVQLLDGALREQFVCYHLPAYTDDKTVVY